jgi:dTMP kinase
VYSNIAYQCAKLKDIQEKEALREWILHTEFVDFALPKPDLNIFLDVPLGFVESKLAGDRKGGDRDYLDGRKDIHEADISFQKAVKEIYLQQCALDPDFVKVDCADSEGRMLPPDEIFARVLDLVAPIVYSAGRC